MEERVGTSTSANRQFVWGLRYIDDLVLRDRDTDGNGTLDERRYCLQDGNWNTIALASTSGTVTERFNYDAYGVPTFLTSTGTVQAASATGWETLYAGYRWDGDPANLYCARNRFLLSKLGVWTRVDPIGDSEPFEYCLSSPISHTDAYGLDPDPVKTALSQQYWYRSVQQGKEEVKENPWKIINPCSKGNFVNLTAMGVLGAITGTPVAIREGFKESRRKMDETARNADNPVTSLAMDWVGKPLSYAGEMNAQWATLYSSGANVYGVGSMAGQAMQFNKYTGFVSNQIGATVTNPTFQVLAGGGSTVSTTLAAYERYLDEDLQVSDLVPVGMSGYYTARPFSLQSYEVTHWGPQEHDFPPNK